MGVKKKLGILGLIGEIGGINATYKHFLSKDLGSLIPYTSEKNYLVRIFGEEVYKTLRYYGGKMNEVNIPLLTALFVLGFSVLATTYLLSKTQKD